MIYLDDTIEAIASRDETDGTYNAFSGRQVIDILKGLPSAEGKEYIKWLEDKLCECEPVWLCEDNEKFTDWCYENCAWSSIQPQCLRHIFSVCGARMER